MFLTTQTLMDPEEQELIESVTREGIVTLNLAEVLHRAIEERRLRVDVDVDLGGAEPPFRRQRVDDEGDGLESSEASDDDWDEANVRADPQLYQDILNNPDLHVEFIYRNRRYLLKPIGTVAPVPKRVYEGENGGMYYWKTRDGDGNRLPSALWTRVYLKDYQRRQCMTGASTRTLGLAGYVEVDGECFNQPPGGRMHAARPPRKR